MPAARRGRLWPGTVPRPPRKRLRLSAEPSRRFKCGSHRIDANYGKVNRNMYFRGTTFSQICHPRTNHFNDLRPTLRSQVSKISQTWRFTSPRHPRRGSIRSNQIEIWFGILGRKALNGASFNSTQELAQAIDAFCEAWHENAHPFVWRKREVRGSQLRNTIVNFLG
jgi:hypothetical protein